MKKDRALTWVTPKSLTCSLSITISTPPDSSNNLPVTLIPIFATLILAAALPYKETPIANWNKLKLN